MSEFLGALAGILIVLGIPITLIILVIRWLSRKSIRKSVFGVIACIGAIIGCIILGVLTDPSTWCKHQYEVIEEIAPTCTEKGKIVKKCSLCEWETVKRSAKIPHDWREETVVAATCTNGGYSLEKCGVCLTTQKNTTNALGHSMKVYSRVEPTIEYEGEIVYKCDRCEYEEKEVLGKLSESLDTNDDKFVNGDKVEGTIPDITGDNDNIVEKLCTFGFTESEAREIREIFLKCGLTNIDNAEPTDPNATIDGLIAYRVVMDKDRIAWFTIENREVFYIGLNGTDVYDTSKGGFLINIDDVHIPESEITSGTADILRDLTETTLDRYFINALYYDGWRYGRADNNYVVQCEVYAKNKLGVKDWIFAKVWYEYDGTEYKVTAVVIDGIRYK